MKKTIKIFTIISGVIMILSTLALLICVMMQGSLTSIYYSSASETEFFAFPVARFVYVIGMLLFSVLLFFSAGLRKLGIWAEILSAVFIGAVLPFAQSYISTVQTMFVGNAQGAAVLAHTAAVNNLASTATFLVPLAASVMLFVCGLSIASKIQKKQNM